MATWPLSIVAIILATACVTFATMTYLERVHGWNRQQAVLAGVPGALSQVLVLAAEMRIDMRGIVMVQTLRVLILAIGVPAGLALFGLVGATSVPTAAKAIVDAPGEFVVLVVGSVVTGIALFWGGFSGGLIFGPMLVSAVLHGGDFVHVALPSWFVNFATVGLGAIIGARFTNTPIRLILSYLGAAIGSFVVAIVITIAFALTVTTLLSLRISDVLVSYAPGSVDVMMIMSLALKLDPVFVGAHHLARVFSVSLTLPFLVRMTAPKKPPRKGDEGENSA
jgi:membrane AbrB-like protein